MKKLKNWFLKRSGKAAINTLSTEDDLWLHSYSQVQNNLAILAGFYQGRATTSKKYLPSGELVRDLRYSTQGEVRL